MTNKLKEIVKKFEGIFSDSLELSGHRTKDYTHFLKRACIAYGKSLVTDIPTLKYTANEKEEGLNYGINLVLNEIQDRISQDELSLGEEKIEYVNGSVITFYHTNEHEKYKGTQEEDTLNT